MRWIAGSQPVHRDWPNRPPSAPSALNTFAAHQGHPWVPSVKAFSSKSPCFKSFSARYGRHEPMLTAIERSSVTSLKSDQAAAPHGGPLVGGDIGRGLGRYVESIAQSQHRHPAASKSRDRAWAPQRSANAIYVARPAPSEEHLPCVFDGRASEVRNCAPRIIQRS
jgi:hypothetical protein